MLGFLLIGCDSSDSKMTDNNPASDHISNIAGTNGQIKGDVSSNSVGVGEKEVQGSDTDRKKKKSVAETKPNNWYVKLVVEDPKKGMVSGSARLGAVDENDAVEKHTLKATPAFGSNYLDVVFRDPAGVDAGDYKVSFHRYEEGIEDTWQFTVRTGDTDANLQLTWVGLYVLTPYTDDQGRQRYKESRSITNPLFKYMKLVDLDSGQEIVAVVNNKVQIYSFNMGGEKERTFEWIVQVDEVSEALKDEKANK